MFGINPLYVLVLGLVCVLLFGNRLPSVMRSLGRSVVEFKKGVNGIEDEIDSTMKQADEKSKNDNNQGDA